MKKIWLVLLVTSSAFAKESFLDSVKRLKWGDLDVVWVEDAKFPRFTASFYFQDGALNDSYSGLSQSTFSQLTSGTSKQNQRELSDFFDFYGVNTKHSVTHEYSVYSVQGLTRDIKPVMSKVCEVFKDAQYPEKELKSYVSRSKSQLKNLVTSHASLADRVFRQVSLTSTPYSVPVEGNLKGYDQLTSASLKARLKAFNNAKKVLYLSGPDDVKDLEAIITKECPWKSEKEMKPLVLSKPALNSSIYLVTVPNANQAQIRIGRYLTASEVPGKYDHFHFLAGFMGGGFTSKLVQELRVKRGLTYSAGAYVSIQRDYGRAGVITFSKNETAAETIKLIRDIFQDVSSGAIEPKEFHHQQGHQIGAFSFGFEETGAFLSQIMLYDHQRRNLEELVKFPETIKNLSIKELAQADMEVFPWERMTIVVVGDKSLEKDLSRIRPVKVLNYQDYL